LARLVGDETNEIGNGDHAPAVRIVSHAVEGTTRARRCFEKDVVQVFVDAPQFVNRVRWPKWEPDAIARLGPRG
jgi:hypothetical protein